jgi:uncharacterized protein YcaQ
LRDRSSFSLAEARRIGLAAQGFDRPRPGAAPDARHYARLMRVLGLLQLDFVNVLLPAQYLVAWSRLGRYDRARFDRYLYASGLYTEQWAHEASVVPVEAWPRLAHRRAAWRPWRHSPLADLPDAERYLADVLRQVQREGALSADQLPPVAGPKRKAGDWHRSIPRWALEHHFGHGALTVRERKANFQRVYDLPERVIPDEHRLRRVDDAAAQRELLLAAAVALGIGTLQDLADYYRMSPRVAAPLLDALVAEGQLAPVAVEGWRQTAYLAPGVRQPRHIDGACLLSPFDPLVWYRPRTERLFDFHYRLEIYVPANRRRWGYYVLPFRVGDALVARVDLKADRGHRQLHVRSSWLEPGANPGEVAEQLAAELLLLADWLGLESVHVGPHGDFARRLAASPGLRHQG